MRTSLPARLVLLAVPAMLAGCDEPPAGADAAARVAEIERVNEGVAIPVEPERILYPDIEARGLTEPACAFAPEGGGMAPVLLAMEERAVMKIGREIEEFAPDKGVQKGPAVAWTRYDGTEYAITLGLGQAEPAEGGGTRYEATLELRDGKDRTVYRAAGLAQCPG